jgi:AraC family transcriptional activator of pobA
MVITMPPGVVHAFDFAADAKGHLLTMDDAVASAVDLFAPLFRRPQALRLHENALLRDRLAALLGQLAQEANAPRYGHALLADWLARSVLLLLVRLETERRIGDELGQAVFDMFSRYRALVEEHYRDAWQMTRYAQALGVQVARLNRVCLKLANKSAFELAQDRLLLEACRRLAYFPEPIAAIGAGLGFGDPAYFSRLFRRRIGMTPKQYREQSRVGTEHGAGA